MSTPKHKKLQRQELHRKQKMQREYEALFSKSPKKVKVKKNVQKTFTRQTPEYPSLETSNSTYAPRPSKSEYTGTYITGLATMHKSNIVPVTKDCNPKDYSTMRRN